jgi:hypothetical protein
MLKSTRIRLAVVALAALASAAALIPIARSQLPPAPAPIGTVPMSPSYVPIGVSASGSGSTAWFHDPSTRQAVACSTGAHGITCQTARLP